MTDNLLVLDSLQAQHSVIGSMLIDPECVGLVITKLTPNDFSDATCRNAFAAAKHLFISGQPIDVTTLQDAVCGGDAWAKWARQLVDITPTSANVGAYADIVRKQSVFFAIRANCQRILDEAVNLDQAIEIVRTMSGLTVSSTQVHTWTAEELANDFIARLRAARKAKFLRWGMPSLDALIQAELGDYILLGGYSSAGKTLLSLQFAQQQARTHSVGYYTLETQPGKMADRLFAYLAELSLASIKRQDLSQEEYERAMVAADLFVKKSPIEFTHAAGWTVEDIIAHAISRGYKIIYIDYVQLIEGDSRESEKDRIARVSRRLKLFGQVFGVAVVGLAQLHREGKDKDGKKLRPGMQSFYGSGQLERDADVAFVLYTKDEDDNDSNRILFVAKNKDGPRLKRELSFHGATQTMAEIIEDKSKAVARDMQAVGRAAKQNAYKKPADQQLSFEELAGADLDEEVPSQWSNSETK